MITLTKTSALLMRSMMMTAAIMCLLAFFVLSDYRQSGQLQGFSLLGVIAMAAGVLALLQQYIHFQREPAVVQLDLENKTIVDAANQATLGEFDEITFFALSTNKNTALIECKHNGKLTARLRRHYLLDDLISQILAKYGDTPGVKLKHIGLTK